MGELLKSWQLWHIFSSFQLNISYPATGCQKLIDIDDDHKLRAFYEKRMGAELGADHLGDEWKVGVAFIAFCISPLENAKDKTELSFFYSCIHMV